MRTHPRKIIQKRDEVRAIKQKEYLEQLPVKKTFKFKGVNSEEEINSRPGFNSDKKFNSRQPGGL